MTNKITVGSKVKHIQRGIGTVTVIDTKTNQCNVDFIRGPYSVCPLSDLKLITPAKTRRLQSTANQLKK